MKTKAVPCAAALGCFLVCGPAGPPPIQAQSNVTVRVMAANLTSGSQQSYEAEGIRIFQGLRPDIVAIQEFQFGGSTAADDLRTLVNAAFGTNFHFYCEPYNGIPNGIVSRFPFVTAGSWVDSDPGISDRGFAWGQIDIPGTNDLYVVSVHLKASNGGTDQTRRAAEAAELKDLIQTNFPAHAWIIVAGDMNIHDPSEGAVSTFATFLGDSPVPADGPGDSDTNAARNERYDRVLLSFSLTNLLVPVVMPSHTYVNGLVFDSRVYTNLTDVPPVAPGDSGVSGMQHMAVVRDFQIPLAAPNPPALPPMLTNPMLTGSQFQFLLTGTAGSNYVVQTSTSLSPANWIALHTNTAPFIFVATNGFTLPQQFYRGRVAP